MKDIKAFANIRAWSGHPEKYVYLINGKFHFATQPEVALDFKHLVYVGGMEDN